MFNFYNTCVGWNPEDVDNPGGLIDMIDSAEDIERPAFLRLVDRDELQRIESDLGYVSHFSQGLTMAADWHVSYHTSELHGEPCAFFKWSAIEHVFT